MEKKKIQEKEGFNFLIEKAIATQEGDEYLISGIATTPNVDLDGEAMSPEAIKKMEQQINSGQIPLVDEHGKGWHDVIGTIVKAWVDERMQLNIVARLDKENSKAMDLYKALKSGVQLGLSVAGDVIEYVEEVSQGIGQKVLTYTDIILNEISVTRRPANYDTWLIAKGGWLGTISKSLNKIKEQTIMPEAKKSEEETEKKEAPKAPVEGAEKEEKPTEKKVEATADKPVEAAKPEAPVETTEKSKAKEEKTEKMDTSKMKECMTTMMSAMKSMMDMMGDSSDAKEEEKAKKEEKKTEKSFVPSLVTEAIIIQKTQQIAKSFETKQIRLIGGMRRLEEQVRAIAKSVNEQQQAPEKRKGIASEKAAELEKNFLGTEKPTEKPAVVSTTKNDSSAAFKDEYKKTMGYTQ